MVENKKPSVLKPDLKDERINQDLRAKLLSDFYSYHHTTCKRRNQSVSEEKRSTIFKKWMGKNIYPIKQEAGFDIDYKYELPMVENWLKQYGGY